MDIKKGPPCLATLGTDYKANLYRAIPYRALHVSARHARLWACPNDVPSPKSASFSEPCREAYAHAQGECRGRWAAC